MKTTEQPEVRQVKNGKQLWQHVLYAEQPLTGYEPTAEEAFAEAFRLFFWNSHLLKLGRPYRYEFIRQRFTPLHNLYWEEVLKHAPQFILEQAARWIAKKSTR